MATAHIHELKRVISALRKYATGASRLMAITDADFDFGTYTYTCAFYEMPRELRVRAPTGELRPDARQLRELGALADLLVLLEQTVWEAECALRGRARRYKMQMVLRSCVF